MIGDLIQEYNDLSADGFRVLAVASRKLDKRAAYSKADESELILKGYIAFLDPPKETAGQAIAALQNNGVTVKVLTGDNDLVTRKVCKEVGLDTGEVLLGNAVENMTDEQLGKAVETTQVFARLSPTHKQRIVEALRHNGHVVGFMGDGINDAPALRAADVGTLGGQRGGHRQGIGRHDPAGEKPDGAGGRRAGRAESLRQHSQIHPHGRQFQFWQHVQRAGGERFFALSAHAADPSADQQFALRFFPGAPFRLTTSAST